MGRPSFIASSSFGVTTTPISFSSCRCRSCVSNLTRSSWNEVTRWSFNAFNPSGSFGLSASRSSDCATSLALSAATFRKWNGLAFSCERNPLMKAPTAELFRRSKKAGLLAVSGEVVMALYCCPSCLSSETASTAPFCSL